MENLKPMTEHLTAPAGSILLRELANSPSIEGAFSSQAYTPLLHAMSAVHGYIVMLVHICRTGQAEIRQLSLQCWGGETRYGRKLLQNLVQLYTALVWESTLLLALCSEDNTKQSSSSYIRSEDERLQPDDFKNVSEITWDKIILTNRRVGVARIVETLENGSMDFDIPPSDENDLLNVRSSVFTPSSSQMKYFKALLGASSRLGRALAELFGLLVKLCVGSPFRQRRQNIPAPSHSNAKEIARVLSRILVDGLTFDKLPPSPIPKLKLTFLICSVGFTSPMLFDDKRYAYHLMLEKFVDEGGLEAFYNMFRWAMTAGGELPMECSIEDPNLPDGTGEFLDAWLLLLEKLCNPKAILDSPHVITSSTTNKNFQRHNISNTVSEFDSISYLKKVHMMAFTSVKYIWGYKPLKTYGSRMSESVLAIFRHIIRGESLIKNKLNDKTKEYNTYIKQLTDMGFPRKLCSEALNKCNGVVEQATEYLLNINKASVAHELNFAYETDDTHINSPPFSTQEYDSSQELTEEIIDDFTDDAISICINLLDELPDTVYRVCDLLIATIQRNGPIWRDYVLDILVEEILDKTRDIQNSLNNVDGFMNMSVGNQGSRASIRIHLFTLLFEGHSNDELRIPCAIALHRHKALPQLFNMLNECEKMISNFYNMFIPSDNGPKGLRKLTPKWLAPLLLLIDLYGKVSLQTQYRSKMHKITTRTWEWYDLSAGRWNVYSELNNKLINDAYWNGHPTVRITCGRQRYTISFNCMTQVNEESGNHRPVMMALKKRDWKSKPDESRMRSLSMSSNSSKDEDDSMMGLSFTIPTKDKTPPGKRQCNADEVYREKLNFEMKSKLPVLENFIDNNNIRVLTRLMKVGLDGDTLHALMRVCLRLTKSYQYAKTFVEENGIQTLISYKTDAGFLGFITLATLLIRHTLEDNKTVKHAMSDVIKSRTLTTLPPGYKDLIYLARQTSAAVSRDPLLWIETAKSILRIDENIIRIRNTYNTSSNEDNQVFVKCISSVPICTYSKIVKKETLVQDDANTKTCNVPKNVVHQLMLALMDREFYEEIMCGEEKTTGSSLIDLDKINDSNMAEMKKNEASGKEDDSSKRKHEPEQVDGKATLLTKASIMKILAAASRSYPNVSVDIVDFCYTLEECPYISHRTSALSYILDFLLIVPDTHRERDCSSGAKLLLSSISACQDLRVLNMVSTEIKSALLRALSDTDFKRKYCRVRLLCELLESMIESSSPDVSTSNKINHLQSVRGTLFHILQRKNLITDLARSTQCMDFTTLFTDVLSTINSILEPLESLIRLSNQPPNLINNLKPKKDRHYTNNQESNLTLSPNIVVASSSSNGNSLTDNDLESSQPHAAVGTHLTTLGEIDGDELISEQPSVSADNIDSNCGESSRNIRSAENITEPSAESSSDTADDTDSNGSEDNDDREIDDEEDGNDDDDEEIRSEMDVDEEDETQQFIEFYDSHHQSSTASSSQTIQNVYSRTNISDLDQGGDDILMIQFTTDQSINTTPQNRQNESNESANSISESHHRYLFPTSDNQITSASNSHSPRLQNSTSQGFVQHRSVTNHPLLLGGRLPQVNRLNNQPSDIHTLATNSGSRSQRNPSRQRRYQYINFNSRSNNQTPVILQRLLGPMAQISDNHQGTTTSFRDATRVVLMDNNGFGLFSSANEDEQLDVVDQAGYLFGRSLQVTLNQTPTALHWWTEESKILGNDNQFDACVISCNHLIGILELLKQNDKMKLRKKKVLCPEVEKGNNSSDIMDTSETVKISITVDSQTPSTIISDRASSSATMTDLPPTTVQSMIFAEEVSNPDSLEDTMNIETCLMDLTSMNPGQTTSNDLDSNSFMLNDSVHGSIAHEIEDRSAG